MFDILLKFYLLVAPLIYLPGVAFNILDVKVFHFIALSLMATAFVETPKRPLLPGIARYCALFIALCLLNVILHGFKPMVFMATLNFSLGVLTVVLIYQYAGNPGKYYPYIAGAFIINVLVWWGQKLDYTPILLPESTEHGGLLGNGPRFSNYLAAIFPVLLSQTWLFLPLALLIAAITGEKMLLAVVVIITILKIKNVYARISLLYGLAMAVFFLRQDVAISFKERIPIWRDVFNNFCSNPLAGYGLGVYPGGVDRMTVSKDSTVYGSFFQLVMCGGIGFAAWLYFCLKTFVSKLHLSTENLSILALILLSTVEYPLEIPRLWFYASAIIGFYLIRRFQNVSCNR